MATGRPQKAMADSQLTARSTGPEMGKLPASDMRCRRPKLVSTNPTRKSDQPSMPDRRLLGTKRRTYRPSSR